VTCIEVRDRLVERSLGALHLQDVADVDRHLVWCAACRREAEQLDRAAATFALTLAPASPPPDLEDRVLRAVQAAAATPPSPRPAQRSRFAVAAVVAATVVISALGWGVAMAGRADRLTDQVIQAEVRQGDIIRELKSLVGSEIYQAEGTRAILGTLAPSAGGVGGGSALTWISPTIMDFAVVTVAGLPRNEAALPYRVWIANDGTGQRIAVGPPITVRRLSVDGSAILSQESPDLSGFRSVLVTDGDGRVVLQGTLRSEASLAAETT
jgi:hypothetical protein